MTPQSADAGGLRTATRAAVATTALGLWSILVLVLAGPLGFTVDVSTAVEVADHVVPGIVVLAAGAVCWVLLRRGTAPHSLSYPMAAGFVFLAGAWITATHAPLIVAAVRGAEDWGSALWHSTVGPVVAVLGVVLFFAPIPGGEGRTRED